MAKGLIQDATWRSTALVLCDTGLILFAVGAGAYARLGDGAWSLVEADNGLLKALLIAYTCQLCFYYTELYDDPRLGLDRRELIVRMFHAFGAAAIILSVLYYWFPAFILGRGVFALTAVFAGTAVVAWRIGFNWAATRVGARERFLLVGTSAAGVALARELHQRQDMGVEVVGFVVGNPARVGEPVFNPGVIGTIEDIPSIVRDRNIDKVVVSLSDARGQLPMDKLLDMRLGGVEFEHLASVYEDYTGKIAVENLRPSWLIFSSGFRWSRRRAAMKRAIDIAVSAVGLVAIAPLMAILIVAVRFSSPGPALYHQERVGLRGRRFVVHKLRSMQSDAEALSGAVWSHSGDVRVTALGRILRRTRLDELPQLWNILRGDMSLVGPRPERPEFVDSLEREIPFYGQRHIVKPGLTGWAQVRYTYGATVEDAMEKLQYDLYYVKNFRISFDIFIIFETVKTVLLGRGV